MMSRCPNCQTVFRITPEQMKARAGKVRCGQCQAVFNALDSLLEEEKPVTPVPTPVIALAPTPSFASTDTVPAPAAATDAHEPTIVATAPFFAEVAGDALQEPSLDFEAPEAREDEPDDAFYISSADEDATAGPKIESILTEEAHEPTVEAPAVAAEAEELVVPLSESAAQELGKATGLIMPRETTEIPGYSKWTEGVMAAPVAPATEKAASGLFTLAALLLVVAFAGQLVFRFRSEIAITLPSLRPALELLCRAVDADLPLPRHVELVSIETSDLQSDPARGNLLVLNATLRNRANYGQAYPALELTLTDTQDGAIARRVFAPTEYLPAKIPAGQPFAANAEVAVRLWIEAREISAAGYRLYVFYPSTAAERPFS